MATGLRQCFNAQKFLPTKPPKKDEGVAEYSEAGCSQGEQLPLKPKLWQNIAADADGELPLYIEKPL
ncbi:MAG: hypothetical protein LBU83_13205 [Bacteroidales bacterium]|jgi:hypothetical protein|nr:hypothetical protein [Bacteroidales bacterium]